MYKYRLAYRDKQNYKHFFIVDTDQILFDGESITVERLGYKPEEFFLRFIGMDYQADFDHTSLKVIGEVEKYENVYLLREKLSRDEAIQMINSYSDKHKMKSIIEYRNIFIAEWPVGYSTSVPVDDCYLGSLEDSKKAIDRLLDGEIKTTSEAESDTDKYIVCWMTKQDMENEGPGVRPDQYTPFIEELDGRSPKDQAAIFYQSLIHNPNTYSANLCKIIDSTDYF